jgi:uncharacterized protein (TIGR00369 family)
VPPVPDIPPDVAPSAETPIAPGVGAAERQTVAERWNAHHAMRYVGAAVDLSDPAVVRLIVDPVQPHHRGGLGTDAVNGVVMAGVFDLAIGLVGHFAGLRRRVGTVHLNIQHMRPVQGDRFEVRGKLVRGGRTLIFASAELFDQDGRVCARCDGMAAVVGEAPGDPIAL